MYVFCFFFLVFVLDDPTQQLFGEETDGDSERQPATLCALGRQSRVFDSTLCAATVARDPDPPFSLHTGPADRLDGRGFGMAVFGPSVKAMKHFYRLLSLC